MQWENLTVPDFGPAVERCQGIGIVAVGVVEPHGEHLPLGQDMLAAHAIACRAAEIEPAIVFPQYPWGINHEAAHLPGAVVLKRALVLQLLENVCDEMGRNGIRKILLLQGHGGNRFVLQLFVQTALERTRSYSVYYGSVPLGLDKHTDVCETKEFGHACEAETSKALHLFPHLVRMAAARRAANLQRGGALQATGLYSSVDWYAMFPTMQVGDPTKAGAEKGKTIVERQVQCVVEMIRTLKQDDVTEGMIETFQAAARAPAAQAATGPVSTSNEKG